MILKEDFTSKISELILNDEVYNLAYYKKYY